VKKTFWLGFLLLAAAVAGLAGSFTVTSNLPVSPGATFLEQSSNDTCSFVTASAGCTGPSFFTPAIIPLVGVNPGDLLVITVSGSMCYYSAVCGDPSLLGAFSSSVTLLSAYVGNVNRITGAINPGLPGVATSTYFSLDGSSTAGVNNSPNSPDEYDFAIQSGMSYMVPTGAQYLFIGLFDSFFADNSGTINITIVDDPPAVGTPEPATWLLMFGGLSVLGLARKLR
jgi:hypothetical protein